MRPLPRAFGLALSLVLALVLAGIAPGCGRDKKKAHRITKTEAKDLQKRAAACFVQGDYACAMEGLQKVHKARPGDAELLNQFAMAARMRYYQSGDMDYRDQELDALRKAIKLAPALAHIQINYATTAWELGMRTEAAKAYTRGLEMWPKHPDAALIRSRIKRSTVEVEDEQEQ
jgi:tetratricopeptide (TPR) repeat protein